LEGINSEEYRQWLFKDRSLLTWLLSTISDNVLPRVLHRKHSHEVWESIHKYFNSVLKSRARQLRSELKNTKKPARSINEYLLRIKTIVNSLIAVGDNVSEQEQVDAILEGLPEDFNSFVMMIYSRFESPTIENVEGLLLLQEVQFEKFKQELANPSVSVNIAQSEAQSNDAILDTEAQETGTEHYNATGNRGRGRGKGRGRGRGRSQNSNTTGKTQCQICVRSNHDASICWYRYDPPSAKPQGCGYNNATTSRPPHFNPYARPTAHLAIPQHFTLVTDFESVSSASWYPDSGASHHLTFNPNNFGYRAPYQGHDQVMMGNGQGLSINSLGHSQFHSPSNPSVHLKLNDMLLVPDISKNLLSVSKFAKDNNVIFEFHPYYCYVKSQDSRQILLQGTVGADGLYQFKPFHFISNTDTNSKTQAKNVSDFSQCFNSSFTQFPVLNKNAVYNSALSTDKLASQFHIWHLRLGYAHNKAVQSVLHLCKIPFSNNNAFTSCTFCCVGKSHKLYAPLSNTVYTKPFEVIHCDLWGPAPFTSYYGYNYYITFVDTYTKYTWIYFLKNKSDALKPSLSSLNLFKINLIQPSKLFNLIGGRIQVFHYTTK
jgi:histone deacetylase 1/2